MSNHYENMNVGIQIEVIVGPEERNSELYFTCSDIARKYGSTLAGNVALTQERPDLNSFHLFHDPDEAEKFRREIFSSKISNAVCLNKIGQRPDHTQIEKVDWITNEDFREMVANGQMLRREQIITSFQGYDEIRLNRCLH